MLKVFLCLVILCHLRDRDSNLELFHLEMYLKLQEVVFNCLRHSECIYL